jgi:hypothetical protein
MEQTFNDLLRERAQEEKGLFGFALWMFVETFAGTIRENVTIMILQKKALIRITVATAFILLLPLLAMQFTNEVAWDLADFAVAGVLLFGAGLTYELIARKAGNITYRAAVGVAVAAALLLVWMNLAVGIIGNEENPANLMYIGVLAVGIIGAIIARFRPRGMARAQVLIAVIALGTGLGSSGPIWPRDVLIATGFFATLWFGSALLFRRASAPNAT